MVYVVEVSKNLIQGKSSCFESLIEVGFWSSLIFLDGVST